MIRALTTAATGLEAQQANIDRISTDLANVNTDGYKRSRTEFEDLMYQTIKEPGAALGSTTQTPVGIQAGMGVKVGANYKIHEQGPLKVTQNQYDIAIEGKGFFPVQMPNGEVAYSRAGAFHLDSTGRLVLSNGAQLLPQIQVPGNAIGVSIAPNGLVRATLPSNGEAELGQIQLVSFVNEQGLTAGGAGTYKPTAASGAPVQGIPGENGLGALQQGALEGSNVNVANSMVEMITAQRAYEMGTKTMKVADEMLGATANIK
jgi:flagellar basal-body rod protein FlgG